MSKSKSKKKGLGRGLGALISETPAEEPQVVEAPKAKAKKSDPAPDASTVPCLLYTSDAADE